MMAKINNIFTSIVKKDDHIRFWVAAVLFVAITLSGLSFQIASVSAQTSCADLSTGYGKANYSFSTVTSGTHYLWLRVKGADSTPALKYNLSGGGTSCNQSMATTGGTNWKWVKSTSGFTTSGGTVSLQISASEAGVGLDCLVLTSESTFSPTSAAHCAGPQVDSSAPTAAFSSPAQNDSVSNIVNVIATASDAESGIQNVTFGVTGRSDLTFVDTTAPYEYALNTAAIANGSITLTVTATNGAGLTTIQSRVVTVNNTPPPTPDTTAPTVSISSPTSGTTIVGDAVSVTVTASDNIAVSKVDLYVDGALRTTDTSSPYSFSASGLSAGAHQLYAIATDTSSNTKQSSTVSVTLQQFKAGDVNGDGSVNLSDFFIIRTNFGQTGKTRAQGDLNNDGAVTLADFFVLRQNFGL